MDIELSISIYLFHYFFELLSQKHALLFCIGAGGGAVVVVVIISAFLCFISH